MKNTHLKTASLATAAAAAAAETKAADSNSVPDLIARIKDPDDTVRGPAWQSADKYGAPAIKPLVEVMTNPDFEIARAAKRAAWKIVRSAGRPGADQERRAVVAELIPSLQTDAAAVRREVLWMLSEIGGDEAVEPVAALLADKEVHDDARAALQRIPGKKSLAALKAGLESAPADFRPAIAESLRVRDVKVKGYPSQKLVPTRPATAKPTA